MSDGAVIEFATVDRAAIERATIDRAIRRYTRSISESRSRTRTQAMSIEPTTTYVRLPE
jgi:hypothetical protein